MTTLAELTDHIKGLIDKYPSKHPYELNDILSMIETLETPVIAVHMDGGLIQDVERLNEAPFTLLVHDHDIEGARDLSNLVWPNGKVEHAVRSDEHTSELQSLMRNSYAVFCLNKKKTHQQT